jgi:small subunit ribosomal protein S9
MSTDTPSSDSPVDPDDVAPEVPADETTDADEETELASGLTLGDSAAGLTLGEAPPEPPPVRLPSRLRGHVMADGTIVATGRRKTAVARVRLKRGNGQVVVNERPIEDFFRIERDRVLIAAPLKAVNLEGQFDMRIRVDGGGITGQAGAIVLGIARCLQTFQPDLHGALSDGGFLTRDDRMVERKKYGHRKARRSFQFSKR